MLFSYDIFESDVQLFKARIMIMQIGKVAWLRVKKIKEFRKQT